jgi:hypothetical protein
VHDVVEQRGAVGSRVKRVRAPQILAEQRRLQFGADPQGEPIHGQAAERVDQIGNERHPDESEPQRNHEAVPAREAAVGV